MPWRNIEVNGKKYKWILASCGVAVREADTMKQVLVAETHDVLGISHDKWYRYCEEGVHIPITPKHVRKLILNNGGVA